MNTWCPYAFERRTILSMTPPALPPEPSRERMTQSQRRRIRRDGDLADMKEKVAAGQLSIRTMEPSELVEAQKQAAARREQVQRHRR
jgi:hypothetical protein